MLIVKMDTDILELANGIHGFWPELDRMIYIDADFKPKLWIPRENIQHAGIDAPWILEEHSAAYANGTNIRRIALELAEREGQQRLGHQWITASDQHLVDVLAYRIRPDIPGRMHDLIFSHSLNGILPA